MANIENTQSQTSPTEKMLRGAKFTSWLALYMSITTKVVAATLTLLHSPDPKKRAEAEKFLDEVRELQRQSYLKRTPFEKTKMSKRTQNVLKKAGFTSLVEVDKLSAKEILAIPGVGYKRAMEILTEGTQNYMVRNELIKD